MTNMQGDLWIQRDDLSLDCAQQLLSDHVFFMDERLFSGYSPSLADLLDNRNIDFWTAWEVPTPRKADLSRRVCCLDSDNPDCKKGSTAQHELEAEPTPYNIMRNTTVQLDAIITEQLGAASSRPGSRLAGIVALKRRQGDLSTSKLCLVRTQPLYRRQKIATMLLQYAKYKASQAGFTCLVTHFGADACFDPVGTLLLRCRFQPAIALPIGFPECGSVQQVLTMTHPLRRPQRAHIVEPYARVAARTAAQAARDRTLRAAALRRMRAPEQRQANTGLVACTRPRSTARREARTTARREARAAAADDEGTVPRLQQGLTAYMQEPIPVAADIQSVMPMHERLSGILARRRNAVRSRDVLCSGNARAITLPIRCREVDMEERTS